MSVWVAVKCNLIVRVRINIYYPPFFSISFRSLCSVFPQGNQQNPKQTKQIRLEKYTRHDNDGITTTTTTTTAAAATSKLRSKYYKRSAVCTSSRPSRCSAIRSDWRLSFSDGSIVLCRISIRSTCAACAQKPRDLWSIGTYKQLSLFFGKRSSADPIPRLQSWEKEEEDQPEFS